MRTLEDFNTTYVGGDWCVFHVRLGDGCTIDFPIRFESRIKWSSVVYNSNESAKPRIFQEMISVTIVKNRC